MGFTPFAQPIPEMRGEGEGTAVRSRWNRCARERMSIHRKVRVFVVCCSRVVQEMVRLFMTERMYLMR